MSRYIKHIGCSSCGSSDGCAVYDNGGTYCFVCHKSTGGQRMPEELSQRDWRGTLSEINKLSSGNLLARGIDAVTAERFGVKVEYDGSRNEVAYYAPLYRDGAVVGYQKKAAKAPGLRAKGDTSRIGETKDVLPFGAHVAGSGGKFLIVVEGVEDALSAHQMLAAHGKEWRVVATMGTEGWHRNLAYFENFEKVCICYDGDEGGRENAAEFAEALSYGKGFIATLPEGTDPNKLLIDRAGSDFLRCVNNARPYEPNGIISGQEMWRLMENYVEPAYVPYPDEFANLKDKMDGMREGEISLWTAGTSVGKTSYIRRLKQWALTTKATDGTFWKVGEVELEESPEKTGRGLMQFHAGKRWKYMTAEEKRTAWEETYGTGRIVTLDKGKRNRKSKNNLIAKFKHLYYDKGVRLFFLDHITMGVREFGSGTGTLDDQDTMMEEFVDFTEKTKSHICLISHLRKPPSGGKSWSLGQVPTEEDMKGSGSLYQIAFDIIGVSRNKQHDDDYERNVSTTHVLKCRETGDTGPADRMYWDQDTSRLVQARDPEEPTQGEEGEPPL